MNPRQRRAEVAARLAPTAPPCFSSRGQWVEFSATAAIYQRQGHTPGPLVLAHGVPVRFNPRFNFCKDCTEAHQGAMQAAGKCKPRYLIELAAQAATKESA